MLFVFDLEHPRAGLPILRIVARDVDVVMPFFDISCFGVLHFFQKVHITGITITTATYPITEGFVCHAESS